MVRGLRKGTSTMTRRYPGEDMIAHTIRFRQHTVDRLAEIPLRQRGETVRNALDAWFEGGTALWRRRYEQERARRLQAEAHLLRIQDAVRTLQGLNRVVLAIGAEPPKIGGVIEDENRLAS